MGTRVELTAEELKSILYYDSHTGCFYRRPLDGYQRPAGCLSLKDGYTRIRIRGVSYLSHRLAWLYVYGEFPKGMLDHINRNPQDSRIENLRPSNHSLNQQNVVARADNEFGARGVGFEKRVGKWRARITVNKVTHWLGYFQSIDDAKSAYWMAAAALHEHAINK